MVGIVDLEAHTSYASSGLVDWLSNLTTPTLLVAWLAAFDPEKHFSAWVLNIFSEEILLVGVTLGIR